MTEETKNAAMSGSIGIAMAIGVSAVLGWFLILGLLFSIQDLDRTLTSETGQPVTQIFLDTVGDDGAIVLMVRSWFTLAFRYASLINTPGHCYWGYVFVWVCPSHSFHHTQRRLTQSLLIRTFSITSNSRMMYAFARDGGIPGHKFFAKVDDRWKSPIRTGS
jgi:amino acid transporter